MLPKADDARKVEGKYAGEPVGQELEWVDLYLLLLN